MPAFQPIVYVRLAPKLCARKETALFYETLWIQERQLLSAGNRERSRNQNVRILHIYRRRVPTRLRTAMHVNILHHTCKPRRPVIAEHLLGFLLFSFFPASLSNSKLRNSFSSCTSETAKANRTTKTKQDTTHTKKAPRKRQ